MGVAFHARFGEVAYGGVDYFAGAVYEESYGDGVDSADGVGDGGAFSEDGVSDAVGGGEDGGFGVGVGVVDYAQD